MTAVADSSSQLFEKLKQYTNYTNDCIDFKYIFEEKDLTEEKEEEEEEESKIFHPEFTHQIFGDDENVFGYKNLHINYYLTPGMLNAYIGLKYDEKISPQRYEGIEPDDVYNSFVEFGCSPNFTKNIDTFKSVMLKDDANFKPYGVKVNDYQLLNNEYEIYRVDSSSRDYSNEQFISYIERLQTMLVYYIETASFVDTDDPQWTFYILYKKLANERYATIGYLSAYNYYAYPDKTRTRISQIMTFPHHQAQGHGARMVQCLFDDVRNNPKIIDVTAESPSNEFIALRDYVTTKMCSTLPIFKDKQILAKGFNSTMCSEALKNFKLPKSQTRRCYEILRMALTDPANVEEWTQFRLDIKKRFYLPFIKRKKCARNGGGNGNSTNDDEDEQQHESKATKPIASDTTMTNGNRRKGQKVKLSVMDSRFSDNLGKVDEESEDGVTTIGFGRPPPSKMRRFEGESTTTIGFSGGGGATSKPASSKSVSFGNTVNINKASVSSLNSSGTTDNDDDDNDENENDGPSIASQEQNLFMSEAERKKYLEEQFQESIKDYSKVLTRLGMKNTN